MSTLAPGGRSFLWEILLLDAVQRISMVCSKSARAATGNLRQKAQVAKKKGAILRALFRTSFAESWMFSQEQLTQESMEGVEAGEGETS